jgi:hypothetical protein
MKQVYTSPRNENVERVVTMLKEAGIATSVVNRRAYAGHDYKGPSYASPPQRDTWPQVWVVNSEDQTLARALLREAGVEPPTRFADELQVAPRRGGNERRRGALIWRFRLFLLACIAVLILLYALGVLKVG